eukprot:3974172-Pleurochrysis_carterae.AAC.1
MPLLTACFPATSCTWTLLSVSRHVPQPRLPQFVQRSQSPRASLPAGCSMTRREIAKGSCFSFQTHGTALFQLGVTRKEFGHENLDKFQEAAARCIFVAHFRQPPETFSFT